MKWLLYSLNTEQNQSSPLVFKRVAPFLTLINFAQSIQYRIIASVRSAPLGFTFLLFRCPLHCFPVKLQFKGNVTFHLK